VLAFAIFKLAVIVPEVVTGVEPTVIEPDEESPTEETVAFVVLHVPEAVKAPVPFPVRHPVRVVAPVPPFATVKALVRFRVPM
jgi:hypothetical protein